MNQQFLEELEYLDITEDQRGYILKELEGINIREDESIIIKSTGQSNEKGDFIHQVLLTNGDMERFICYI